MPDYLGCALKGTDPAIVPAITFVLAWLCSLGTGTSWRVCLARVRGTARALSTLSACVASQGYHGRHVPDLDPAGHQPVPRRGHRRRL